MRRAAVVVIAGLATGAITQLLQGVLPTGWSQAANAISPWLLVAFLVGSAMPRPSHAAIAGIATLALALVGYYAMVQLRFGYGGSTNALVFWSLGAIVGGPVFGAAGFGWRNGTGRIRAAALGLVAAAAIAEGGYHAIVLGDQAVAMGFVVAGLISPLILGRTREDRVAAYVAAVPALALGALGFVVFLTIYDLITRL